MNRRFTAGDRVYEIIPLDIDGEPLYWKTICALAERCGASAGQEDGEYIYLNQRDVDIEFREGASPVFPWWHGRKWDGDPENFAIFRYALSRWDKRWYRIANGSLLQIRGACLVRRLLPS